jgi:steroid delta-isomerase-like uncharacterized protein
MTARLLILQIFACTAVLVGCATRPDPVAQRNKEIVRRYFDRWANHGDTAAADELIAPNLVLRSPPAVIEGLETYKRGMATFHAAFPDLKFTIDEPIAEKDRVVVHWTLRGSNVAEYQGHPPSWKSIDITGVSIFRLAGGKIAEITVNMDRLAMQQQLGWIPAPAPAGK